MLYIPILVNLYIAIEDGVMRGRQFANVFVNCFGRGDVEVSEVIPDSGVIEIGVEVEGEK